MKFWKGFFLVLASVGWIFEVIRYNTIQNIELALKT